MKKISIIIFLMISLASLLLSGCDGVGIIPEVNSGNSEYQEDTSDTGTISDINNDKTPPEVTITLPGTGEYVLNQLVIAIWSATDDLSGVVSPISGTISIDTSSEGTKTLTLPEGTVKDKAGNKSKKITKSYKVIKQVIGVDTTKPVINGLRVPLPNSFGWNNTDVEVIFTCADTDSVQSGIDINTVEGTIVTTEGKNQSVTNTGTCIDKAGNIADPVTISNINIDKTPPVVTITLPKNGKYSLNESITATWSATDALSGVEDSKAPKTIKINTKSKGKKNITLPAGIVKDEAGNSSEEVIISYEVVEADTTKPVITGSRAPLPNVSGWNNTNVTVSFSCDDVGTIQSGIDVNTVAGKTVTTEGKNQSVTNTGTCIDKAGNIADPAKISGINIDKTPPMVTITLPGTGEYNVNESVTATWVATDSFSGFVSPLSGTVSIDTSSAGSKTITLPAGTVYDKAGNGSLKVSKSYSIIKDNMDDNFTDTGKWPGLGMVIFSDYESYINILMDNGFTEFRIDIPDYQRTQRVADSKAMVQRTIAKGAKVIWGVSSNSNNNPDYTITAENWPDFRQAILSAAQWAQDNGIYEFQLGNEEENHVDGTTITGTQLITNMKALAIEVKQIFTNGNVSYSTDVEFHDDWITAGKGDLDILAFNIYRGHDGSFNDNWKTVITSLVNAFGVNGTYITEFSLSWNGLDDYSEDEAVQAAAISEMIDYIKASGMERACFFTWANEIYGVVKDDGTYRELWSQALLNSGSVKFASIPTRTTKVSLPNTIALMPK